MTATHPRQRPRFDHALALRLDDAGKLQQEIADACGVTKAAISHLLCRTGRRRGRWPQEGRG